MKKCDAFEELLARYHHGELLRQDREILERHLSACPDCERLHRDVGEVNRSLRDLPGKQMDPPAWLRARILANLPEERAASAWVRWGRWASAAGALAACALAAAVALYRVGPAPEPRVASAPPPASAPAPGTGPAGTVAPQREAAPGTPSLRTTPGALPKRAGEADVASAPKVRVIQQVKIFFYYPPAQKVAVTGDFNGWNVDGVPLQAAGKPGLWETELRLPPGVYSYNFIVDGELLLPDPNAPNQMPDGYGGTNSLLLVKGENAV